MNRIAVDLEWAMLALALFVLILAWPCATAAEPVALEIKSTEPSVVELERDELATRLGLAGRSEPCSRLQTRSFWAEATSLATASMAVALGGGSFVVDGGWELGLRLTGVVLSGVSAGAAYLGQAYGGEYRAKCGDQALRDGGDDAQD